jgi:hypothetical protein
MCLRLTLAHLLFVLAALCASGSFAMGQETAPGAFRPPPAPKAPPAGDRIARGPLSDQECRDFAQLFVDAVKSGDRAALDALFDWETIWKTATTGFELSGPDRAELFQNLTRGALGDSSIGAQLIKNSKSGGEFDTLRIRQSQTRRVILFRMIQPLASGGVG